MQGKMKAQMFYAPGDVRFEETDIPQIKDGKSSIDLRHRPENIQERTSDHYHFCTFHIRP